MWLKRIKACYRCWISNLAAKSDIVDKLDINKLVKVATSLYNLKAKSND